MALEHDISAYLKQYKVYRNRLIYLLVAVVLVDSIGEGVILRLGVEESLKASLLAMFTYGLILIPIPLLYVTGWKKKEVILFLVVAVVIMLVNYLVKAQIVGSIFSLLFLVTYLEIGIVRKRYSKELESIGISFKALPRNLLYGIIVGLLLGGHMSFAATLSGSYHLVRLPWEVFLYHLFFAFALSIVGEEIFYRGLIFRQLSLLGYGFWGAASVSAFTCIFRYLVNPQFFFHPLISFGTIFYLVIGGVIYCALFRWTKSLVTSATANLIFSMFYYSLQM